MSEIKSEKLVRKYRDPFDDRTLCCLSGFRGGDFDHFLVIGYCGVCNKCWYKDKQTGKLFRFDTADD